MLDSKFLKSGVRKVSFSPGDTVIERLKENWQTYVATISSYSENRFYGKGIVMSVGGLSYFTCSWMLIHQLRRLKCGLPIEIWYMGKELSSEVINMLEGLENVVCKDYLDITDNLDLQGVMLKPLAILASEFEEVLFLDADNNCLQNPEYLFQSEEYLQTGALFWPDYWLTDRENPIWKVIETNDYLTPEQESGQIMIDKSKCWKQLNLCLYFNVNHKLYYKMIYGDKDTFKFAWRAFKTPFHMIKKGAGLYGYLRSDGTFAGTTIVQHGTDGKVLFLHRNLLKWDKTNSEEKTWEYGMEFIPGATQREYELRSDENKQFYLSINGDTRQYIDAKVNDLEVFCLQLLSELRNQPFYLRYQEYCRSLK